MHHAAPRPTVHGWLSINALGVTAADLVAILADAGRGGVTRPSQVEVSPVRYELTTPATAALLRVTGLDDRGERWSLFCKVIQHPRHWLAERDLPDDIAGTLITAYPWKQELGLWDEAFAATMPRGLRAPRLYRAIELADDRIALWMEDVSPAQPAWDTARFARAARLLGEWNQRASQPSVVGALGRAPHFGLKTFAGSMLRRRGLQPLADDDVWAHPWLADAHETRAMLGALAAQLDALITRLDGMPLCRPHGDACPQNLLVPTDAPDTFVAIDISQQAPTALGCDLAQLAVGLVHAGARPANDLTEIVQTTVPEYIAGLRAGGWDGRDADVVRAFWTAMLIRSGFDSLPYERLDMADEHAARPIWMAERIALTTFIAAGATAALRP